MGNVVAGSMTRAQRGLVVATIAAAIVGSSGCSKLLRKRYSADAGPMGTATVKNAADDADEQLQEKLDAYIKCLNTLSSPVHSSRNRYFSWVNPKTGPTGHERWVYGIYELPNNSAQKCSTDVAKAKLMPPHDEKLEAAGTDFAQNLMTLDALIDQAYEYYENKNYKDDNWAKGKALHPQLMAAFQAFSKADTNLHVALDGVTKPLSQRTLARIERDEGKKFRWHRKNTLIEARELIESGDPIGEDDTIDFALYNAAFAEFEAALAGLEAYAPAHLTELQDQRTAPAWPLAKSNYDQFVRYANDYKKKAREWLRCLRDAPARAKTSNGKIDPEKMPLCPDGRPRDVVAKYNEFIRNSNDHSFP